MNREEKQAVLDVLNSFEVQDSQGGEECFILVESSEENLSALEKVGVPREVALGYGDEDMFCIAAVAFDLGVADVWRANEGLQMYSEDGVPFPLQPEREGQWFLEYKFLEEVVERSATPISMEQAQDALMSACELLKIRQG